jgi:membrane protease YdiL (CAAX protease family)
VTDDLHADRPPPWSYLATLVWVLLASGMCLAAALALLLGWTTWRVGSPSLQVTDEFLDDPFWLGLAAVIGSAVLVAVVALAARLRGWSARDYLGLRWPAWRHLGIALVLLAVLSAASEIILRLLEVENPVSLSDEYREAKEADALSLLWINVVIAAPVAEEILFRGFLQRGWVRSQYGAIPGIVIISAVWAALHFFYGWILCVDIFVMGLLFGWVRWWSGSTIPTILMHAFYNLYLVVQVVAEG